MKTKDILILFLLVAVFVAWHLGRSVARIEGFQQISGARITNLESRLLSIENGSNSRLHIWPKVTAVFRWIRDKAFDRACEQFGF